MLRVKSPTGSDLARIRVERLLTQADAASQVGCSVRAWQDWESGKVPQFRYQRALIEWANGDKAAA